MSEPRPLNPDELPLLGELLNDVFRRSRGVHDQDVLLDFPLVFARENLSNCWVIRSGGRLVSHAAVWPRQLVVDGRRFNVGVITLVATHADFRHRGHAARLVTGLQELMRAGDYDLGILWTGVPDFYRRLGWQDVQPQGWLVRDIGSCRRIADLTLREAASIRIEQFNAARHQQGIVALHDREPVQFTRRRAEHTALLSLPKLDVRVLLRDGQVTAYLVNGRACNKRGLLEYGGAADDIGALIAHVSASQPSSPLPLVVHHTHPELSRLLEGAGAVREPLPCSKGPGCEMVYPVRPERLDANLLRRIFVWGLDVA